MSTIKTIAASVALSLGITAVGAMCLKNKLVPFPSPASASAAQPAGNAYSGFALQLAEPPRLEVPDSSTNCAVTSPSPRTQVESAETRDTEPVNSPPEASTAEILAFADEAFRQEPRDASWAGETERALAAEIDALRLPEGVKISPAVCRKNLCKLEIAALEATALDSAVHTYARRDTTLPTLYVPLEDQGRTIAYNVFVARDVEHIPTPPTVSVN